MQHLRACDDALQLPSYVMTRCDARHRQLDLRIDKSRSGVLLAIRQLHCRSERISLPIVSEVVPERVLHLLGCSLQRGIDTIRGTAAAAADDCSRAC